MQWVAEEFALKGDGTVPVGTFAEKAGQCTGRLLTSGRKRETPHLEDWYKLSLSSCISDIPSSTNPGGRTRRGNLQNIYKLKRHISFKRSIVRLTHDLTEIKKEE